MTLPCQFHDRKKHAWKIVLSFLESVVPFVTGFCSVHGEFLGPGWAWRSGTRAASTPLRTENNSAVTSFSGYSSDLRKNVANKLLMLLSKWAGYRRSPSRYRFLMRCVSLLMSSSVVVSDPAVFGQVASCEVPGEQ